MHALLATLISLSAPSPASAWVDGTYVCDVDQIKSKLTITTVTLPKGITMPYVVCTYSRPNYPPNLVFRGLASSITFPTAEELLISNGNTNMVAIRFLPTGTAVGCDKQ